MIRTIDSHDPTALDEGLEQVAGVLRQASCVVALTGAGVSIESGIPGFRSAGGLWSRFDPWEFGTLSCFLDTPAKSWLLFRALGKALAGKSPNPAHFALAALERGGWLRAVVTQNVDGLHQAAGSRNVHELHGDHGRLQCLGCGWLGPFEPRQLEAGPIPACPICGRPLKPNVILFEEMVRELPAIEGLLDGCDLLLVVGTSAVVTPASQLPERVLGRGGSLLELNTEPTPLTRRGLGPKGALILGPAGTTLPQIEARLRQEPRPPGCNAPHPDPLPGGERG
jgi:NAD-dependent deacetylase